MGNISAHQNIIFDKVHTNEGASYNSNSGIFTCVTPGVYVFFLNVMTHYNKIVEVELLRNGKSFLVTYSEDNALDNGSNMGVMRLGKGDSVWPRVHYKYDYDHGDIIYPRWTTFSGFLLTS